jgi:hypothetical protein
MKNCMEGREAPQGFQFTLGDNSNDFWSSTSTNDFIFGATENEPVINSESKISVNIPSQSVK